MEQFWKQVDHFFRTLLWALAGALLLGMYTERLTWDEALWAFMYVNLIVAMVTSGKKIPKAVEWTMCHWRFLVASVMLFAVSVVFGRTYKRWLDLDSQQTAIMASCFSVALCALYYFLYLRMVRRA